MVLEVVKRRDAGDGGRVRQLADRRGVGEHIIACFLDVVHQHRAWDGH
jgi:hypothetical protein